MSSVLKINIEMANNLKLLSVQLFVSKIALLIYSFLFSGILSKVFEIAAFIIIIYALILFKFNLLVSFWASSSCNFNIFE